MNTLRLSLKFPHSTVNKPIISNIIKKCNVDINILHADIKISRFGSLIVDVTGSQKSLDDTIEYLEKAGVEHKTFVKNILRDEEKCIHCGLCTGVCHSQALYLDKKTAEVLFDFEKCVVCGFCAKACPLRIIEIEGDLFNV